MTAWPAAQAELRHALLRADVPAAMVDRALRGIGPAFAALERERGAVEPDLLWALIAVQADRVRRSAIRPPAVS